MPTSLSRQEVHCRLRYRGFLRADGSLDRNALRNAIVELGWIYASDLKNNISEQTQLVDSLPEDVRQAYAEQYIKIYISLLIQKYTGVSLQGDEWALGSIFPVLEDFLSRVERQPKQSRNALRTKFTGVVLDLSKKNGKSVEEMLLILVRGLSDLDTFREITGAKYLLDVLYSAATVFEFVQDVCPLECEQVS